LEHEPAVPLPVVTHLEGQRVTAQQLPRCRDSQGELSRKAEEDKISLISSWWVTTTCGFEKRKNMHTPLEFR